MPRFIPPPGPGRPKGSRTKQQLAVEAKLAALGCDPITAMAALAMDRATPLELRAKLYCELAQYVAPRRKAADPPVAVDLPTLRGPRDAVAAAASLLGAVGSGAVTPGEAGAVGRVVDLGLRAIELGDIESRLQALEGRQG
jgi:hypothetical protein